MCYKSNQCPGCQSLDGKLDGANERMINCAHRASAGSFQWGVALETKLVYYLGRLIVTKGNFKHKFNMGTFWPEVKIASNTQWQERSWLYLCVECQRQRSPPPPASPEAAWAGKQVTWWCLLHTRNTLICHWKCSLRRTYQGTVIISEKSNRRRSLACRLTINLMLCTGRPWTAVIFLVPELCHLYLHL